MDPVESSVIEFRDVDLERGDRVVLEGIAWRVRPGEHWAVVGPNGAGKTTLLQLVLGYLWPTRGSVSVLGRRYGEVDLRQIRRRIGWVSSSLAPMIRQGQSALQIVAAGAYAATGLFVQPELAVLNRAGELLDRVDCAHLAAQPYATLSLGEQQKVLIARALMGEVELLILDEACAGLDLGAREALLEAVEAFCGDGQAVSVIFVTHHIEEIPPSICHALVLKAGRIVTQGPKRSALTGRTLSEAFDLRVEVKHEYGRCWSRIRPETRGA